MAAAGLIADLASKEFVQRLRLGPDEELFPGSPILGIVWRGNQGGVFGLGQQAGAFFVLASIVAIVVILWMVHSAPPGARAFQVVLGLIFGGALGNLYDRVYTLLGGPAFSGVRDFVNLHFISWYAFNLADVFISTGCVLLALRLLFDRKHVDAKTP